MSTALRRTLLVLQIVFAATVAGGAPINDNFADRIVVTGAPVSVEGTTVDGTLEVGEPQVYHQFSTVWYEWAAPEHGNVRVRFLTSSSTGNFVQMYRGSVLPELHLLAQTGPLQEANVDVVAGAVYQFRISADQYTPFPRLEGPFTLLLDYNAAPVNDHFTNRIRLTNAVERIFFRNLLATLEPGETSVASAGGGHSIWYEWQAPASGEAHLRVGAVASVGVYAGTASERGSLIASNVLEGGQSLAETIFDVVAGGIYHLVVDRTGGYPLPDTVFTLTLNGASKLERVEELPGGFIQMMLIGERNRNYALETSTNLIHWTAVSTNLFFYDSLVFYDLINLGNQNSAPRPSGIFYRARLVAP